MTAAALRSRVPALKDPSKYPDADLVDYIAEFADIAERYRGVRFTPTTSTETLTLDGDDVIRAQWAEVRSVTSVTVTLFGSTTTLPPAQLQVRSTGDVYLSASFYGLASMTYTHGLDAPTSAALRACRQYVRSVALRDASNVGRDVIAQGGEPGTGSTRYALPDWDKGRPTGYIEPDRILNSLRDYRTGGIG